jgi:DTW domain-containing protein YfiP
LFGKKKKEDAEKEAKGNSSDCSRNNSDNNNEGLAANNHLQTQHRIDDKSGLITSTKGVTKGETTKSNSSNNLSSQQNQQQPHSTATTDDFVMKTIIARRLGIYCDSNVMKLIHDPNEVVVLVFPHDKALDLDDGLRLAEKRCKSNNININNNSNDGDTAKKKKMTLIFIDATWKYAKEMDKGTDLNNGWPTNLIRVQLTPSSSSSSTSSSYSSTINGSDDNGWKAPPIATATSFIERRFHIRTPPSSNHLCTAECIAYIVSRVESNPMIYTSIMTAVDYMVTVWNQLSIANTDDGNNSRGIKTEMSQKKKDFDGPIINQYNLI